MQTKYTTGDMVYIPAKVVSAEERDGAIYYRVDANIWDGIKEDDIRKDDNKITSNVLDQALKEVMGRAVTY